jgi:hypothetical protein
MSRKMKELTVLFLTIFSIPISICRGLGVGIGIAIGIDFLFLNTDQLELPGMNNPP